MPRTILCSAGTSIALGTEALKGYQNRASAWEDDTSALAAQIRQRLAGLDLATEAGRVRASAELNALHRLPVRAEDEVVLFATDTADGRCCAEAVAEVLRTHFGLERVKIERVVGLQVREAARLRDTGLVNLTRKLIDYLDDPQRRYGGGCVLNTNGGFKGIVPFFAILGMIFRAPVVYVFEFAECLIQLPPLPVGFATDLFDRALPALRWAEERSEFEANEFFHRIPGLQDEEREWFGSFLEVVEIDGRPLAALSPLAKVLVQREGGAEARLLISPLASREIEALSGPERKEVQDHLRKLASPLWRSQHRDSKHTNDLEFYPRGHNPWRFAGFAAGGRFHLCWFARHDAYDRLLAQRDRQHAAFPEREFVEYSVPTAADGGSPIAETDPDFRRTWPELHAEVVALREKIAQWQESEREARAGNDQLRRELKSAHQKNAELSSQNQKFQQKVNRLEGEARALRQRAAANGAAAAEAPDPGPVSGRYLGKKERSHRFAIVVCGEEREACVPAAEMEAVPAVGGSAMLILTGQTCGKYNARPVPPA